MVAHLLASRGGRFLPPVVLIATLLLQACDTKEKETKKPAQVWEQVKAAEPPALKLNDVKGNVSSDELKYYLPITADKFDEIAVQMPYDFKGVDEVAQGKLQLDGMGVDKAIFSILAKGEQRNAVAEAIPFGDGKGNFKDYLIIMTYRSPNFVWKSIDPKASSVVIKATTPAEVIADPTFAAFKRMAPGTRPPAERAKYLETRSYQVGHHPGVGNLVHFDFIILDDGSRYFLGGLSTNNVIQI